MTESEAIPGQPDAIGAEWERITRAAWAIHYDWTKREKQAIEDFILTVRHSIADVSPIPSFTGIDRDAVARAMARRTSHWSKGEREAVQAYVRRLESR